MDRPAEALRTAELAATHAAAEAARLRCAGDALTINHHMITIRSIAT